MANTNNLIEINSNSYFYDSALAIGVILNVSAKTAILIDSGLDESNAKKINNLLKNQDVTIKAIINTHSHADHCGGNAYLQKVYTDIAIYASSFEKVFIDNPTLEPFYLSNGATPFIELRDKFLQAQPSKVTNIIDHKDHTINIDGSNLEIVTLPGHTFGSIGIGNLADGVFYCGDAIFGIEVFNKHKLTFITNVAMTIASCNKLIELADKYQSFVIYHGGLVQGSEAIKNICNQNISNLQATVNEIFDIIKNAGAISIESLIQKTMHQYQIDDDVIKYTLTRTALLARLEYLQSKEQIRVAVRDGVLMVSNSH
jgi:glyoxylase-like metal-dependent hydrolase (beta-lactamase superfamily II)